MTSLVIQAGGLLLALVGGVVAFHQWRESRGKQQRERIKEITERKPIVFTDAGPDGKLLIRNVGQAPALNVWLITDNSSHVALGSLSPHETAMMPESVVTLLNTTTASGHILLASARPLPAMPREAQRPYTVTFNARTDEGAFRHALDHEPSERLVRAGSVAEYLDRERVELIRKLATFAADTSGALGI